MSVVLRLVFICFIGFLLSGTQCSPINNNLVQKPEQTSPLTESFAKDTVQIKEFCRLSQHYLDKDATKTQEFAGKALYLSHKIGWDKGKLIAYNLMSSSYLLTGDYEVLRQLANETFNLADATGLVSYTGHAKRFIGEGYGEYRDWDSARVHYAGAIKIFTTLGEDSAKALCLESMGGTYREEDRFAPAIDYYNQAFDIFNRVGSKSGKASVLQNLGFLQIRKHNYEMAATYFLRALELYNQTPSVYGRLNVLNDLANAYNLDKKFDLSEKVANEAMVLAKLYHSDRQTNWALEALARSYKGQNRLLEAIEQFNKVNYSKRHLYEQSLERQYTIYRLVYENEQMVTAMQKKTIADQRTVQQVLTAFLLLIVAFAGFLWFNNNKLRQKNAEIKEAMIQGQTIERKRVAAELHDNLGGTLASLNWYLYGIDKKSLSKEEQKIYESVHQMVGSAYKEVRSLSHNLMPAELEEFGLIVALTRLIDKLNESKLINFTFTESFEDKRLSSQVEFELYSIALELANNILKHSGADAASIDLSENAKSILLVVKDNGMGMPSQIKQGMGLGNIKNRVQSLSGKIDITTPDGKGTIIEIEIPKNGAL